MQKPIFGILPGPDSREVTPQNAAGILKLPPTSLPTPIKDNLAAIAAASPPELPPTDFLLFHGLRHRPHSKLCESKFIANCGKFVLINGIIPETLITLAKLLSYFIIELARTVTPTVEAVPSNSILSLREIGTPYKGGKYLSIFHSSSKVQFFFPLLALC